MTARTPADAEGHHEPFAGSAARYRTDVERSFAFARFGVDHFAALKAVLVARTLADLAGDPRTLRVLDIGCGIGALGAHLSKVVRELHGVDPAPDMIELAARNDPLGTYRILEGASLPYADGAFDAAIVANVLHHVLPEERDAFAARAVRVIRPGGVLVAIEHNPWNPLTRVAVRRCALDDECELLRRSEVERLLTRAGLVLGDARYVLFTPWAALSGVERALAWLPLGAQHLVAGRAP